MFIAQIAVFQFFLAKFNAGVAQVFFVVAKFFDLALVVFVDGLFDRDGARHGRLFTQQCGAGTQRKSGHVPQGHQRGGAHAAI